jgi:hypothetical protein
LGVAETTPKPPLELRGLWGRDLPEDLSMEILSRLPVKSLICCKCISKSWYAVVTYPSFITKHLKTSHNSNRGAAILGHGGGLEHLHLSTLSNETVEVYGVAENGRNFFFLFLFFLKKYIYFLLKKNLIRWPRHH